jgi:hypothetical protein
MISVDFPELESTSEDFFATAASTTRPLAKRKRLQGASSTVATSIEEYRDFASRQTVYNIAPTPFPFAGAGKKDFGSLYKSYLQSTEGEGRAFYDALIVAHESNVCPYCGTRQATTLDHYLPQKHFPHFAITFENLVASCSECNLAKSSLLPTSLNDCIFHPYYESMPEQDWLAAEVNYEYPVTVSYELIEGIVDADRISFQFEELELAGIFAYHASNELRSNAELLKLLGRIGSDDLQNHLASVQASAAMHMWYPWKPVLYGALASDTWFCEEGFELLE